MADEEKLYRVEKYLAAFSRRANRHDHLGTVASARTSVIDRAFTFTHRYYNSRSLFNTDEINIVILRLLSLICFRFTCDSLKVTPNLTNL